MENDENHSCKELRNRGQSQFQKSEYLSFNLISEWDNIPGHPETLGCGSPLSKAMSVGSIAVTL